jgi:hypothetical protein
MDMTATRTGALERSAKLREIDETWTEAERISMRFDIVDLIVNGASLRQVAAHFDITPPEARNEYRAGIDMLRDRSIDASMDLRDEVTMRQRELILSNMARAKAGDVKAATIVQKADDMLTSIWGLRSLRIDPPRRPPDPGIAAAMEGYLAGLDESTKKGR